MMNDFIEEENEETETEVNDDDDDDDDDANIDGDVNDMIGEDDYRTIFILALN